MKLLPPLQHLHGHVVIQSTYPDEYRSLVAALERIQTPLRSSEPFTKGLRPDTPKRQRVERAGRPNCYKLLPVDQNELNAKIATALKADGWDSQPIAISKTARTPKESVKKKKGDLALTGDFVRNKVFVEVEFGNTASMFRDLFKFQIAKGSNRGDVAVLIVASDSLAKLFDSGVANYSAANRLLPYMSIGYPVPIWIIGIEPEDFAPIKLRYEQMERVCKANGINCLSYDEAARSRLKKKIDL